MLQLFILALVSELSHLFVQEVKSIVTLLFILANLVLQICPILAELLQQGFRLGNLIHDFDALTLDRLNLSCEGCSLLVCALLSITSQLVKLLELSFGSWQ